MMAIHPPIIMNWGRTLYHILEPHLPSENSHLASFFPLKPWLLRTPLQNCRGHFLLYCNLSIRLFQERGKGPYLSAPSPWVGLILSLTAELLVQYSVQRIQPLEISNPATLLYSLKLTHKLPKPPPAPNTPPQNWYIA